MKWTSFPQATTLRFQSLFPNREFVDASDAIRKIRMVKSEYEVGQIRQAALMLKRAFTEVPGWMGPGTTELELQGRLEGFLRQQGHQGITRMRGLNYEIAYGTVSSGPSASYPTCFPGPVGFVGLYPGIPNGGGMRQLAEGDPVMADIVGGYGGYIADKTRTYVLGELPRDMRDGHEFILEMMGELRSMLRPGARALQFTAAPSTASETLPMLPISWEWETARFVLSATEWGWNSTTGRSWHPVSTCRSRPA